MTDNKQILHFRQVFPSSGNVQEECRLRIQSDINRLAEGFMEEAITPSSRPHVRLPAATIKEFGFRLEAEDGTLVAGCTAYFVNGAILQYQQGDVYHVLEWLPEDKLHDTFASWLADGMSFALVTDFHMDADRGKEFGEWLARYVPRILSDVYGLTFGKVAVVFHDDAFAHGQEKDEDELCKKQLAKALAKGLESIGYKRIEDTRWHESAGIMALCLDM